MYSPASSLPFPAPASAPSKLPASTLPHPSQLLPSSFPLSALLFSSQLCSYPIHALLLFLPCSCFAPGLLLAYSWSCLPQFGSLHHHQHLTTYVHRCRCIVLSLPSYYPVLLTTPLTKATRSDGFNLFILCYDALEYILYLRFTAEKATTAGERSHMLLYRNFPLYYYTSKSSYIYFAIVNYHLTHNDEGSKHVFPFGR